MQRCSVVLLEEVDEWYLSLEGDELDAVTAAIEFLEEHGPDARRPMVGLIEGSKIRNLKELIPPGTSIRVLFAFDPNREAVLLLAGDKRGEWKKWYRENIRIAEERFEKWKADL